MQTLPLQSLLGIFCFILLAFLLSEQRQQVSIKTIVSGLGLQFLLALLLIKTGWFTNIFLLLNGLVQALLAATLEGTGFVLGYLGGAELPFTENSPGSSFILAFQALPLILLVSALSALLFYWKILPRIVWLFSLLLEKSLHIRGSVSLGCAANIFVGMVEAPLLIKEYLKHMNRSELFIIMTTGMATIAGTVMVLYSSLLAEQIPNALGHIITASLISAPAAILIALIMVPDTETSTLNTDVNLPISSYRSAMDAVTRGTMDGVQLLINIIAMLIVLVALVALCNQLLALLPGFSNPLTLQQILGYLLAPIAWLLGIPWDEALLAGNLLGTKIMLNEFLAYLQLGQYPEGTFSPNSQVILTYALCGFANFGSLGIMIAGMTTMVPEKREEIISLGIKSIVSGNLATFMTAAIIALIL